MKIFSYYPSLEPSPGGELHPGGELPGFFGGGEGVLTPSSGAL